MYVKDWLNDPLMEFDNNTGEPTYLNTKNDVEADKWQLFHFATRLKLEGAVHFCRLLLGVAKLPEDMGLYLLAHRQKKWYAGAFFFELCAVYDTLLQELNIIYCCGINDLKGVKWTNIKRENKLPKSLEKLIEREWKKDWFSRVRWYRNTATHHYIVPMAEGAIGWRNRTGGLKGNEVNLKVNLIYIDEETEKPILEDIGVCAEYLNKMIKHIHNVWSVMRQEFH